MSKVLYANVVDKSNIKCVTRHCVRIALRQRTLTVLAVNKHCSSTVSEIYS